MPNSGTELNGLHILVVDDDEVILDLIEAMLKAGGARVTRATSGSEAFGKIAKSDRVVDCILCDYGMSPGNGLQLLHAVRTGMVKQLRADSCFVLLTGSGDPDVVKVAAALDVSGYLMKPATPEKLRTAIVKGRSRVFPINIDKYNAVQIPI